MVLARWEKPITDDDGNIVTNVYCEVRREVAGAPLAVLYSDRNGTSAKSNPFLATDGVPAFHAVGGAYSVRVYKAGYDKTYTYQALGTGAELDADSLLIPGYLFEFETGTSAPPSAGGVRANNASLSAATRLYVSQTNVAGADLGALLAALASQRVLLTSATAGEQASWSVGLATDQGSYYELVLSSHAGATAISAGRCGVQPVGAAGADGANGLFNGQVVTLSNASETLVAGYNGDNVLLNRASAMTLGATAAATLGAGYMVILSNINTGTVTFDPDGAETVDGAASIAIPGGTSVVLFCDGTNWRSMLWGGNPLPVAVGGTGAATAAAALNTLKAASVGAHSNLGIAASVAANALTVAIKGADGADPSASNPVVLAFRDPTLTTGTPLLAALTAPTSITISSGSTMGAANATAFALWLVAFTDAGTVRLGLINCLNGKSIVPLRNNLRASSLAEGGAGGADAAGAFYTGTAVTSRDYIVLGRLEWASGLTTAGTWASTPTRTQIHFPGMPLPGDVLQVWRSETQALDTTTTTIPRDDTIPQITEGKEFAAVTLTPQSAANVLRSRVCAFGSTTNNTNSLTVALFQDATANALAVGLGQIGDASTMSNAHLEHVKRAGATAATTLRARYGAGGTGTGTLNGANSSRLYGGVASSYLQVEELVA